MSRARLNPESPLRVDHADQAPQQLVRKGHYRKGYTEPSKGQFNAGHEDSNQDERYLSGDHPVTDPHKPGRNK